MKNIIKTILLIGLALPVFVFAQTPGGMTIPQGGTGNTAYASGTMLISNGGIRFSAISTTTLYSLLNITGGGGGGITTWLVGNQFLSLGTSTDSVLIGTTSRSFPLATTATSSTLTSTAKLSVVGDTVLNGNLFIGTSVLQPQLNAFGSGYHQFQMATSSNDITGMSVKNTSSGPLSGTILNFTNDRSSSSTIGFSQRYGGNLVYSGSNFNGALVGANSLPPNSLALFVNDGSVILGAATSSIVANIDMYTGGTTFFDGMPDFRMNNVGDVSIGFGTTTAPARLSIRGSGSTASLFDISTTSSSYIRVLANGRTGFGTSTPDSVVHIIDPGNGGVGTGLKVTNALNLQVMFESLNSAAYSVLAFTQGGGTARAFFGLNGSTPLIFGATTGDSIIRTNFAGAAIRLSSDSGVSPTLTLLNSQNVGVGSSTPIARFVVKGGGTTTGLLTQFTDSANTPKITFLDNGNVGIGTISPLASLHVNGGTTLDGTVVTQVVTNSGDSTRRMYLGYDTTTDAAFIGAVQTGVAWKTLQLNRSGGGVVIGNNVASPTGVGLYVATGAARFIGSVTQTAVGVDRLDVGVEAGTPRIVFEDAGSDIWLVDNSAGIFRFYTPGVLGLSLSRSSSNTVADFYTSGGASTVKLHTAGSSYFTGGNVGIGTTTPTSILSIGGVSATVSNFFLQAQAYTSNLAGAIWNDLNMNLPAFSNGNTLYVGGNMYTATGDQTINSTTPTTTFSSTRVGTTTIQANTLKVGQKFTIWGAGYYSTPVANTSSITITTSIASTTAATIATVTTGAFPSSASNLPFELVSTCTVRSIGVAATIVCDGDFRYATALSSVAKTSNSLGTIGTIVFNSTVNQTLDVKASWSAVTTQSAVIQESRVDF